MIDRPFGASASVKLPHGLIDRITPPFVKFLCIEATGGAVLLLFTIAALILSNSPWSGSVALNSVDR